MYECLTEYDEKKNMDKIRRDSIKFGRELGLKLGREQGTINFRCLCKS